MKNYLFFEVPLRSLEITPNQFDPDGFFRDLDVAKVGGGEYNSKKALADLGYDESYFEGSPYGLALEKSL